MHPHHKNISDAKKALEKAHADVAKSLAHTALNNIRHRLLGSIESHVNYLSTQLGEEGIPQQAAPVGQLRKVFGRELIPSNKSDDEGEEPAKAIPAKTADQIAADELRESAIKLKEVLPTLEPAAILDTYGELEIRAVGKLVGLPVTETTPAKVDVKFIEQIKEAMKKAEDLANKGNS